MSDKPDHVVLETMMRYGGSFARALAQAARFADPENLKRIKTAWPEMWTKYSAMAQERESCPAAGCSQIGGQQ